MIPARHALAARQKPDAGKGLEGIEALAIEIEQMWEDMPRRMLKNKQSRGETSEQLTEEEQTHAADSKKTGQDLDKYLDRVTRRATSAREIIQSLLPMYQNESSFWQKITKNPADILPEDKAVIDDILAKQQLLINLLSGYLRDEN